MNKNALETTAKIYGHKMTLQGTIDQNNKVLKAAQYESDKSLEGSMFDTAATSATNVHKTLREGESADYKTESELEASLFGTASQAAVDIYRINKRAETNDWKDGGTKMNTNKKDGKIKDTESTLEQELAKQSALDAPSLIVTVDPGAEAENNMIFADVPAREKVEYILPPTERRRLADVYTKGGGGEKGDSAGRAYLKSIGKSPTETIWLMWKQFGWSDKKRDAYLNVIPKQTIPPVE